MEKKFKHLDLVQGIMTRMASNSFMLKGWAVTLMVGIFALASKDADKRYFLLAYVPLIVFWFLDAYYLQQERLYRCLYERVTETEEENINFCLKAATDDFPQKENKYWRSLFSKTELLFYLPLIVMCTGGIVIACVGENFCVVG